jgi:hypothetical protein
VEKLTKSARKPLLPIQARRKVTSFLLEKALLQTDTFTIGYNSGEVLVCNDRLLGLISQALESDIHS